MRLLGIVFAAMLVLAACGGGDETATAEVDGAAADQSAADVDVDVENTSDDGSPAEVSPVAEEDQATAAEPDTDEPAEARGDGGVVDGSSSELSREFGFVENAQLIASLYGPTTDVAASASRLITFPSLSTPADTEILDIQFSLDLRAVDQTILNVVFATSSQEPLETFDNYVAELAELGFEGGIIEEEELRNGLTNYSLNHDGFQLETTEVFSREYVGPDGFREGQTLVTFRYSTENVLDDRLAALSGSVIFDQVPDVEGGVPDEISLNLRNGSPAVGAATFSNASTEEMLASQAERTAGLGWTQFETSQDHIFEYAAPSIPASEEPSVSVVFAEGGSSERVFARFNQFGPFAEDLLSLIHI